MGSDSFVQLVRKAASHANILRIERTQILQEGANRMSRTIRELSAAAGGCVDVRIDGAQDGHGEPGHQCHLAIRVVDERVLRASGIDVLVNRAVFGGPNEQAAARWLIWELGQELGVRPASIHELYVARGVNALPHSFTTPAMNIRMLSYDTARAALSAAMRARAGAFIFELARSEMVFTEQRPSEYASVMIAAAIKEGFRGPLFIQGDHFQIHPRKFAAADDAELSALRALIDEALSAGYYNIDIDASTLVDLTKPDLDQQQRLNYEKCALLSDYIRARQPAGVTVSLGGEIGEVGHKNSNVLELRAFMDGYNRCRRHAPGISKISIQTGTSHGGTVLPDGTMADVSIDFDCLHDLSVTARIEYGMGGAVQHGASTLPEAAFGKFVKAGAIEVHLATALQQVAFDCLPKALDEEITQWLFRHATEERKPGDTDRQFLHKARKKATGAFKKQLWSLPETDRARVRAALEQRFTMLFHRLGVDKTRSIVDAFVSVPEIHKTPEDFAVAAVSVDDAGGLAD
jgi:fructose/tagatose bisphosphate aldolase